MVGWGGAGPGAGREYYIGGWGGSPTGKSFRVVRARGVVDQVRFQPKRPLWTFPFPFDLAGLPLFPVVMGFPFSLGP